MVFLLYALLFSSSVFGKDPSIQNHNMHVVYHADANQSGAEVDFLLDISEITGAVSVLETDFAASFQNAQAKSTVTSVKDISEEKKTTVLAFDDSISMRKGRPLMIAAAKKYLRSLNVSQKKDHTIDIVLGAMETKVFASDLSPEQAIQKLATLPKPNQKNTALRDLLTDAIEEATTGNDPKNGGMRQVILFSDGEEESSFSASDASMLTGKARSEGVQIHFLFINRNREKKPEAIAKIKRFQSIADGTGGVDVIENVVGGQGALDKGAERIADKIGKLRRVRLSICEAQQTGDNILKLQYGASDYAWVEHHLKNDSALKQDCPCVPTCVGGETCSSGECLSTDEIKEKAGTSDKADSSEKAEDGWKDWWWLLLIPLLLLFLFRKKKSLGNSVVTLDETPVPDGDDELPLAPSGLGVVTKRPISYNMVLRIYQGAGEQKKLLKEMTLMHKEAILGRKEEGAGLEPSHIIQHDALSKHHLKFFLNDDRTVEIQDMGARNGVIIEDKDSKEWKQLEYYERVLFDFEKDVLILFDGNGVETEEVWVELVFPEEEAEDWNNKTTMREVKEEKSSVESRSNTRKVKREPVHPHVKQQKSVSKPRSKTIFEPKK